MITISSTSNQKIKNIIALQKKGKERRAQGSFVAEGKKMVMEVLRDSKNSIQEVYVTAAFFEANRDLLLLPEDSFFLVADSVMNSISETMEPQGVLAVVKMPEYRREMFFDEKGVYLALFDIRDPGNLGTILRTAEAAGIKGILMSPDTVDVFNPKVVRSTMGAIFRVPFLYSADFLSDLTEWKEKGAVLFAAHLSGEKSYREVMYPEKTVLLVGNEANGLSPEVTELSDIKVIIPMKGNAESLNAAVAAALLSFEACQKR